ncbi:MAG: VOC family protein [Pseudonocardiaceae bacterium]
MNREPRGRGIPGATNVDHIAYTVPDLEQAVDFFTEVLGAELIYQEGPVEDPGGRFMSRQLGVDPAASAHIAMLRLGPVTNLELFEYQAPTQNRVLPRNSDWGGHHLAIHVTDLDDAVRYLEDRPGVRLLGDPQVISHGPIAGNRWIYFLTPWGMQMELVQTCAGLPYERTTTARRYGPAPAWNTANQALATNLTATTDSTRSIHA